MDEFIWRARGTEEIPANSVYFSEDMPVTLSERDARRFMDALDNPPPPNSAALQAAKRFEKSIG